jgi:DNA-binding FadR family transcriptional regulator
MPEADRSLLARPDAVAARIADLLADGSIPSGSRLLAQNPLAAGHPAGGQEERA